MLPRGSIAMPDILGIPFKDFLTIVAIILGPILAVQAQSIVQSLTEKEARRITLFKTLMSTRAQRLSRDHVQALNMIDIEFYGRRVFGVRIQSKDEKAVTNQWKTYNDHLNDRTSYPTYEAWARDGNDKFTKLLYEMSRALDYDYDEVQLKRDCYRPEAHVNLEIAQIEVLDGMAKVLKGEMALPTQITNLPNLPRVPASPATEPAKTPVK